MVMSPYGLNEKQVVAANFSLFALLFVALGSFTPTLEAVNSRSQEEAGHDGHYRHRDAGEYDDEQVCESQCGLALSETVFRELREGDAPPVHGEGALHTVNPIRKFMAVLQKPGEQVCKVAVANPRVALQPHHSEGGQLAQCSHL